jgi:sensor histidine kinase YesM
LNKLICFCFLLYFNLALFAQSEYDIQYFGEEQGFYDADDISDIKIDSSGYVWIISFSGITRYDGIEFKQINVNSTSHSSFLRFQMDHNNVPFVTDISGGIYFIQGDSIVPYKKNSILKSIVSGSRFNKPHFTKNGDLYYSISKIKSEPYKIEDDTIYHVWNKAKDFYGLVYILTRSKPIILNSGVKDYSLDERINIMDINGNVFDSVFIKRGLNENNFSNPDCIYATDSTYLLSSGKNNILLASKKKIIKTYLYDNVTRLLKSNDRFYISTSNDGIHVFNSTNFNEKPITKIFSNQLAFASSVDHEGGIWVYSQKGRLARIKIINSKFLFKKKNSLNFLSESDGKLYYNCSSDSINVYDNKLCKDKSKFLGKDINRIPKTGVYDMIYDSIEKRRWYSSRRLLFSMEDKPEIIELNSKTNISKSGIRIKLGKIHSLKGLGFLAFKANYLFHIKQSEIVGSPIVFPSKIISAIGKNDTIWVATEMGLYFFEISNNSNENPKIHLFSNKIVNNLFVYYDEVYLNAKNAGIFKVVHGKLLEIKFNGYQIRNSKMIINKANELWSFSNLASLHINYDSTNNFIIESYKPIDVKKIKLISADSSNLYFSNFQNQIRRIEFKTIKSNQLKKVSSKVNKFSVNDLEINMNDSIFYLKYNENNIRIHIESIMLDNFRLSFRYRLNGLNDSWEISGERIFPFYSLLPGVYEFEFQSQIGEQPWSESKTIEFEILKPYWQEWWFYMLCFLFLLLSVYLVIINRVKRDRKENDLLVANLKAEQRALRAQINPHFIFNIISSAQYFILKKDNNKANQFLNMFSGLLRKNLKQAGQNLINLKQEIEILDNYIQLEKFRLENKFDYSISINGKIDQEIEEFPQFLIQPFVENAIQHGLKDYDEKGTLSLIFSIDHQFLKVEIIDNGIGYNTSIAISKKYKEKRKSYGTEITVSRLNLYNEIDESVIITDFSDTEENKPGTKVVMYIKRKSE